MTFDIGTRWMQFTFIMFKSVIDVIGKNLVGSRYDINLRLNWIVRQVIENVRIMSLEFDLLKFFVEFLFMRFNQSLKIYFYQKY